MNTLNRVIIVVLLLVLMVACTVLFLAPRWWAGEIARQADALDEAIEGLAWYEVELPGGIIALVIFVVLLLLLILEVRRPKPKFIRVEKVAGGEVQVSVSSIADRVKYEVDALSGVVNTKPKVSGKRGGVIVELDVETAAGVDVPVEAESIMEKVRQVVESQMGLKLQKPPRVNLRAMRYPKAPQVPLAPSKPSTSEEEEPAV